MSNIPLIFLVFALVLGVIEAFWPTWSLRARPHCGWLAFACFIAYMLMGR